MLQSYLNAIRESFWFRPAIYNVAALVLAILAVLVDLQLTPETSVLGVAPISLGRTTEMLAALAGAILTMTTITFSGILVVLTTYSSQFSPRVLQNFVANRATQHVLALFSSGFTFCVLALLIVSEEKTYQLLVTPAVAIFWCLAAIAAFIFLLTHTASWLRVNNLIGYIAGETGQTIRRIRERPLNQCAQAVGSEDSRWQQGGVEVNSVRAGYVVFIDFDQLLKQARQDDLLVRLEVAVGSFVVEDTPVMTLVGADSDRVQVKSYRRLVRLDIEPRSWQDIGFGIRKVAEIGLRAISPSINDPYTAATAIHYLSTLLVMLAQDEGTSSGFADDQGQLRLLVREPGFDQHLLRAFQELRRYGSEDNTTLAAILTALGWVATMSDPRWHDLLWEFGADTYRLACRSNDLLEAEHRRLLAPLQTLAQKVSRESDLHRLVSQQSPG